MNDQIVRRLATRRRHRKKSKVSSAVSSGCSLALLVDFPSVVDGPEPADEDEAEEPHQDHSDHTVLDGVVASGEDSGEAGTVARSENVQKEANESHGGLNLDDGVFVILFKGVHII